MPAMKLTPNAAMRARDVSRPRAEHLAEAEAAEAQSEARGGKARGGQSTGARRRDGTATARADERGDGQRGARAGHRGGHRGRPGAAGRASRGGAGDRGTPGGEAALPAEEPGPPLSSRGDGHWGAQEAGRGGSSPVFS